MDSQAFSSAMLAQIERFAEARILCVGDVMLDKFVYGDVSRVSPEAPVPVLRYQSQHHMLGGAGNVARNIVSLGAQCHFISVTGADAAEHAIRDLLQQEVGMHPTLIADPARPTSIKTRFIGQSQQLLRFDEEDTSALGEAAQTAVLEAIVQQIGQCDLLLLSDYAKGVLTDRVIREAIGMAQSHQVPCYVDPKRTDFSIYRGANLLSPNMKEMMTALPDPSDTAGHAQRWQEQARQLANSLDIACLAVTQGKAGMSLITAEGDPVDIPAHARDVFDVSGAGDTVIATFAVASASGFSLQDAGLLANLAGGIAVSRMGTATVYRTDLKSELYFQQSRQSQSAICSQPMAKDIVTHWKTSGLRVGFTNGCFDLLHSGHLQSLEEARQHCDKLVVAINSDSSVTRLKGPGRPINLEMDRAHLLAGLACVDLVVIFREDTPEALLQLLRPDVLMKGADYSKEAVVGGRFVESYGGEIKLLSLKDGYSSTQLIAKAKNQA